VSREHSLPEELLRPNAFAQVVDAPGEVAFVETHISWVFMLGRDVFKLKRPVNLGFLDFTTPEKRKAACDAEVLLNRRLAPDVYHGVVPIVRGADGHARVGGEGDVVDHAVHMVRLRDERRMDCMLAAGLLTPTDVDTVAIAIAKFHARCRSDAETSKFGAPSILEQNIEENFAQTNGARERYLRADEAREMVRWQRAFLRGHAALFERRMATGRVRDGHGDLRLEHVFLDGPRTTIIDCIEFNERFRFADVCADIAFLSMDLARGGRVDLAERLVAAYARESNDLDLYAVLDFYESYRAFVRGKIAAMIADDPAVEAAARERAAADARQHFLLALSADRRSMLMPAVVAVGGVIASGKSTVAESVGAQMSAPIVDADRTRKSMLGVESTHRIEDSAFAGAYDPKFTESVYAEVLRRAQVVLSSGRPVVIDASFRSEKMRHAARELAIANNAPFRFVECRAPLDVCRARLQKRERGTGVSDGRLAIFDDFVAKWSPPSELLETEHIVLDTTQPLEREDEVLRAALSFWPAGFVA